MHISNHDGYYDGAGAQTQRIFSVYCLANALQIPFIFKPIEKIELQPIDFITSEDELSSEITLLNKWVAQLLGVQTEGEYERLIRITKTTQLPWRLLQLITLEVFSQKKTKITFLDGYFASRVFTQFWDSMPPLKITKAINRPIQIHLHLRLTNFVFGDREVGIAYFRNILEFAVSTLNERAQEHRIVIHTDFIGQTVRSDLLLQHAVPESLQYWKELGLIDENLTVNDAAILQAKRYLNEIASVTQNAQIYNSTHWVDEWESMATADLFIMGKSSFSAVGGLLNAHGIVVGPNYWNSGKENWCVSDDIDKIKPWIEAKLSH